MERMPAACPPHPDWMREFIPSYLWRANAMGQRLLPLQEDALQLMTILKKMADWVSRPAGSRAGKCRGR
jgi:hypothetical protein